MLQGHPEWGGIDLAAAPTVFADLTAYRNLPHQNGLCPWESTRVSIIKEAQKPTALRKLAHYQSLSATTRRVFPQPLRFLEKAPLKSLIIAL